MQRYANDFWSLVTFTADHVVLRDAVDVKTKNPTFLGPQVHRRGGLLRTRKEGFREAFPMRSGKSERAERAAIEGPGARGQRRAERGRAGREKV